MNRWESKIAALLLAEQGRWFTLHEIRAGSGVKIALLKPILKKWADEKLIDCVIQDDKYDVDELDVTKIRLYRLTDAGRVEFPIRANQDDSAEHARYLAERARRRGRGRVRQ